MEQLGFSQLLCIAGPQHVFLGFLAKQKKTGLPVDPGGQPRATEGPSSQKDNTFLWLLLDDCVFCHQRLAWLD